jgi:hypothetical protein
MALEDAEGGLGLARRARVQLALDGEQLGRGREGAARHGGHRGAGGQPGRQRQDVGAGALVQGEQHPGDRGGARAVRGERAHDQVRAVPGRHHQTALGEGGQEAGQHRAAEDEVPDVPGESGVVAEEHFGAEGAHDLRDGGRRQRLVLGQYVAGHREPGGQPLGDLRAVVGDGPVDDDGDDVAALCLVRAVGVVGLGADGLRVLVLAADDRDHRGAELVGEPGVQPQLVREAGVGVVAAQDQDVLVVAGHLVEAADQPRDQLVGALLGLEGGGLLVAHAARRGGRLAQPVARPQQVEEAVGVVVHQGTEDADPVDMAGQQLHDPQLDDLAAVTALDPGHIHAARHACSPFPRRCPCVRPSDANWLF